MPGFRFEEGLKIISHLLQNNEPLDFAGEYYQLHEAVLLPRPKRPGGPPVLISGNGPRRTLPLVAQFATEWNGVYLTPERFAKLSAKLDELLAENGRSSQDVRRSMMTGLILGKNQEDLEAKLAPRAMSTEEIKARGPIVETGNEIVEQLGVYAEAGVQRIKLQWIDLDDIDGLEALGTAVLPQLK